MQSLAFTQGDDWQIDWYLEELVGSSYVAVNITNITFAMSIKSGSYQQAFILTKISSAGGHVRATLSQGLSQQAPIGTLMSNLQMVEGGVKTSSPPFAIECIEDFTP